MTDAAHDLAHQFAHDTAAVREATDRLFISVAKLDDDAIGEPSLLPDWTRGHVLAHLARNADALANLLTWARTGVRTPMYASGDARNSEIERDADRPLTAHITDLRASAARFATAAQLLSLDRLPYEVEMRNGVVERAARLPFRRLTEVELHHVDLGVGYTVDHLPAAFLAAELRFLAEVRLAGRPDVPPLELRADNGWRGRTGRTATDSAAPLVISGPLAALVGWLTGRGRGVGLTTAGAAALPELPPF